MKILHEFDLFVVVYLFGCIPLDQVGHQSDHLQFQDPKQVGVVIYLFKKENFCMTVYLRYF